MVRRKKKSKFEQKKLEFDEVQIVYESKQSQNGYQQNSNKSRKRKKDKFAGLNAEIMLKHQKTINANKLSQPPSAVKRMDTEKPKQVLSKNLKKEKRKLKTNSMLQSEKLAAAKKQKNNLLQLVNVLKKQQNQIANNSGGLKIEHLLKREN